MKSNGERLREAVRAQVGTDITITMEWGALNPSHARKWSRAAAEFLRSARPASRKPSSPWFDKDGVETDDAPKWFKAVLATYGCCGCHFFDGRGNCTHPDRKLSVPRCTGLFRADGKSVIFTPRKTEKRAQ